MAIFFTLNNLFLSLPLSAFATTSNTDSSNLTDNSNTSLQVFISEINFRGSNQEVKNCSSSPDFYDLELETVSSGGLCNYDQWFELSNPSSTEVDIAGWVVSFRPKKKPTPRFIFPNGAKIKADGSLVVGFNSNGKDTLVNSKLGISTFSSVLGGNMDYSTDQIFYISNDSEDNTTLRLANNNDILVDSAIFSQSSLGGGYQNRGQSYYRCQGHSQFILSKEAFVIGNLGTPGQNNCPKVEAKSGNNQNSESQPVLPTPIVGGSNSGGSNNGDTGNQNNPIQESNPNPVQTPIQNPSPNPNPNFNPILENSPQTETNPNPNPILDPIPNPISNPALNPAINPNTNPALSPNFEEVGRAKSRYANNFGGNFQQDNFNEQPDIEFDTELNTGLNSSLEIGSAQMPVWAGSSQNQQSFATENQELEQKINGQNSTTTSSPIKIKQENGQIATQNQILGGPSKLQINLEKGLTFEMENSLESRLDSQLESNLEKSLNPQNQGISLENRVFLGQNLYFWFSVFASFNFLAFWFNNMQSKYSNKYSFEKMLKQFQNQVKTSWTGGKMMVKSLNSKIKSYL